MPFIRSGHKKNTMSNKRPIISPLYCREYAGSVSLTTLPLNVWSALIISLALTKAHLLPAPVLLFKPYLLTPSTWGDKQRLDTQAALSKPPPTHFDQRCLALLASFLMLSFLWMWFGVIHKMPKQQCAFELPLPGSCFILHPTTIPLQHHLTQRHTQAGTHTHSHTFFPCLSVSLCHPGLVTLAVSVPAAGVASARQV